MAPTCCETPPNGWNPGTVVTCTIPAGLGLGLAAAAILPLYLFTETEWSVLVGLFFFTHTLLLHTLFVTVVTHATNGFIPHV